MFDAILQCYKYNVSEQYVVISVFDAALKCLVLALGHIPSMGLRALPRLVLHILSPTVVIGKQKGHLRVLRRFVLILRIFNTQILSLKSQ